MQRAWGQKVGVRRGKEREDADHAGRECRAESGMALISSWDLGRVPLGEPWKISSMAVTG